MFRFIDFVVAKHRDHPLQSGFAFMGSREIAVAKFWSPCTHDIDREVICCIEHEISFRIRTEYFGSVSGPFILVYKRDDAPSAYKLLFERLCGSRGQRTACKSCRHRRVRGW